MKLLKTHSHRGSKSDGAKHTTSPRSLSPIYYEKFYRTFFQNSFNSISGATHRAEANKTKTSPLEKKSRTKWDLVDHKLLLSVKLTRLLYERVKGPMDGVLNSCKRKQYQQTSAPCFPDRTIEVWTLFFYCTTFLCLTWK